MDSHNNDTITYDLHEWAGIEYSDSVGAELADCEAVLNEFEQQAVRTYWDQVIAEELGAVELQATPFAWSELGTGERTRMRRLERRTAGATLRLITTEADEAFNAGEAA